MLPTHITGVFSESATEINKFSWFSNLVVFDQIVHRVRTSVNVQLTRFRYAAHLDILSLTMLVYTLT